MTGITNVPNNAKHIYKSNNYIDRRIVESCPINSYLNINMSTGQYSFNCVSRNKLLKYIQDSNTNHIATEAVRVG